MIETSREQTNDENHDDDQDHDHNTFKKQKEYEIEKLENNFISAK